MKAKKLFEKYQNLDNKEKIKFSVMMKEIETDNNKDILEKRLETAKELLKTFLENSSSIINKDWLLKKVLLGLKENSAGRKIDIK